MGSYCAPLAANLHLFCFERYFMLSISNNKQADAFKTFDFTSRYLDDLLNIDTHYLEQDG